MKFKELETERLKLIEITEEHAMPLYEIFSLDEVTRYYGMEPFTTVDDAANLIHSFQRMFTEKRSVRWGLQLKDEGRFIGTIGLNNLQIHNKRTEIGYEIHPHYWRKGLVSEALSAVLKYIFEELGLYRAAAVTFPENLPSSALLEKHSFQKEGLLRGYIVQGGQSHDAALYSLLKPDWEMSGEK
ncbi:GNAT family N-acetyltransferase [Peribacillus sp. SCS-37]|uniref:GNAT family N-acetyltransferase n=1 Tax=Paraperibacillus esterisolvens TaxID=3115296 RepID=UPI003905DB7E